MDRIRSTTIRMTTSIDALPSLASSDNKVADVHVGGQRRLLTYATAVDAVSATLMSNQFGRQVRLHRRRRDSHQLVFTAPTRRYYMQAMQRGRLPAMGQCISKRLRRR